MAKNLVVKELGIENLSAVLQLQDKIIENLHEDEKHFILKRSVDDFMKALDSESTHMLGVFDGDKLVAQSIFDFPQNGQKRDMPEFAGEEANDDLVIYKAILVDSDYRGTGLMRNMLDFIEKKAVDAGKKSAIIQIAVDNPASWISAMKNGMTIRKVDLDPEDSAKVLYLQKDFNSKGTTVPSQEIFPMYLGKDIHKEIPALFNKMQYLIKQGYQGVGVNKEMHAILWSKPVMENQKDQSKDFFVKRAISSYVQSKTTRY